MEIRIVAGELLFAKKNVAADPWSAIKMIWRQENKVTSRKVERIS